MFKLTEYTSKGHAFFAFSLQTPHEYYENRPHNVLNICLFRHSWWLSIPELIKPKTKWVDTSEWSKDSKGYWDYIQRIYGFTFTEDSLHVHYGIQPGSWSSTDKKNSDHTKVFFYSWQARERECIVFMNDKGIVIETYSDDPDGRINFKRLEAARENAPIFKFTFNDFDNEEITATCRIEKSIYRRGKGLFKWLQYCTYPEICKNLDISFSKETGYEKGSWKGGTIGHSIAMHPGETALEAFTRYGQSEDRYRSHGTKNRGFTNIRTTP